MNFGRMVEDDVRQGLYLHKLRRSLAFLCAQPALILLAIFFNALLIEGVHNSWQGSSSCCSVMLALPTINR